MIQRIQSLYLLLATGTFCSLFALPFLITATTDAAATVPQLADGQLNLFDNIGLLGLTALGIILAFGAVFMYKNRPLQAKVAILSILVSVLLLALAGISAQSVSSTVPPEGHVQFGLGWVAPVVGLILSWLAAEAIKKDEKLVRSMDRLR